MAQRQAISTPVLYRLFPADFYHNGAAFIA